jgi:hypothetical protein
VDHLVRVAWHEGIWRTVAAIVMALVLAICLGRGAASGLMIVAHVALLFAVLMIRNAMQLVEMARPKDAKVRPAFTEELTGNRAATLTLGFAKVGSAVAAAFAGLALMLLMSA